MRYTRDTRLDGGNEPGAVNGEELLDVLPCRPGVGGHGINAKGELKRIRLEMITRELEWVLTNNQPAFQREIGSWMGKDKGNSEPTRDREHLARNMYLSRHT